MTTYSLDALTQWARETLEAAGATPEMAQSTARALVDAEAVGLRSHGLARLSQYASHLRSGRVNAKAVPFVRHAHGAAALIDADEGLAFPACDLAINEAIRLSQEFSIAFVGVTRSHHFGAAGNHLERIAASGLAGFAFTNSPAAMPAWGGRRALFGTNPIAATFPRQQDDPVTVDLSLSKVARGKLLVAARDGQEIPLGWALDAQGQPTSDPRAGLKGMMCPAGDVKGAMLALVVELLCVSLTGAAFGFEADSFFDENGNRPHIGHAFIAINPSALVSAEVYHERIETLLAAMLVDEDVRIPGYRRADLKRQAQRNGIEVSEDIAAQMSVRQT